MNMKTNKKLSILVLLATLQAGTASGFGIQARSHGQPIHESITEKAALDSGILTAEQKQEMKHLLEGARFNDDPEGYLIEGTEASKKSLLTYGLEFVGSHSDKTDPTQASHFGDYQFLHAMSDPSKTQDLTKKRIIYYSSLCWDMATSENSFEEYKAAYDVVVSQVNNPEAKLTNRQAVVKEMIKLFPKDVLFFHAKNQMEFQFRALGSLLHIVQDSYAKGHAVRVGWEAGDNSGKIRYYQDYSEQDSHAHADLDNLTKSDFKKSKSVAQSSIEKISGANAAYERSKQILTMFKNKCPWTAANLNSNPACEQSMFKLLNSDIFDFSDDVGEPTHSHPELVKPERSPFDNNGSY